MATSSSIDFTVTARDLVSFALLKLSVIKPDEDPSAAQLSRGIRELNLLLKAWMKYESMWRLTEAAFFATDTGSPDQTSYTLSPVPYHVYQVRFRSGTTDTELMWMPRGEYYALPSKTTSGPPTRYYIDYQRSAVTFKPYPIYSGPINADPHQFRYTYLRKFEDIDSPNNEVDIRQEWFDVVGWNLAARLAPDYGKSAIAGDVMAKATALLNEALGNDRHDIQGIHPPTTAG